jgi:hypothetical protein
MQNDDDALVDEDNHFAEAAAKAYPLTTPTLTLRAN